MLKRKKFLFGGIIILLALGYLGYTGFVGGASYYYTVSELLEQRGSVDGENVRVNGQVAPGSLEQESGGLVLRFTIFDGEEGLPVVYQGAVPDSFKVGNDVIVEGYLDSDGIFQAQTMLPKCASKYAPKQ